MGRLPSPAWDESYHWDSLAAASANPRILPGSSNTIITANTLVEGGGEDLQADYDTPFRAQRIAELLMAGLHRLPGNSVSDDSGKATETGITIKENDLGWTAETLAGPQYDVQDAYALHLLDSLPTQLSNADADPLLVKLRQWDGVDRVEGEAALFWLFERQLWNHIFGDELEKHQIPTPWTFLQRQKLLRVLDGESKYNWTDNVQTQAVENLSTVISSAINAAWQEGVALFGDDLSTWTYGQDLHSWTLPHHLDAVPILGGKFTRGPYAIPGSATTVNAMGGANADWKKVVWGPSMRVVWDTGNWDQSRAVLPGGQSGHFNDPNYDDQIPLYLKGQTRVVPWSPCAIDASTLQTLLLAKRKKGDRK